MGQVFLALEALVAVKDMERQELVLLGISLQSQEILELTVMVIWHGGDEGTAALPVARADQPLPAAHAHVNVARRHPSKVALGARLHHLTETFFLIRLMSTHTPFPLSNDLRFFVLVGVLEP